MSISVQPRTKEYEESSHWQNGVNGKAPAQPQSPSPKPTEPEPRSEAGLRVSEEEYWQFYYHHLDFNYEWNNGILEEKPMAKVKGSEQYQWFFLILKAYSEMRPGMRLVNLEIGFRLALSEKTTIRKPDLFIVLDDNPIPIHDDDATFRGICDVCVESLSDSAQSEINRDVISKRDEYAEVGVREYYILDAGGRYTTFYRQAVDAKTGKRSYELLPVGADGVVRSGVMPGFQFRVRDLYQMPPLEVLVEDEVYRGYVWRKYQEQKQLAEQEAQRANEAEALVEQERQRTKEAEALAEQERQRVKDAEALVEQERQRASAAEERAAREQRRAQRYAERLRLLGLLDEEEA